MKPLSIENLADVIDTAVINNNAAGQITGISTDSRQIKPGDCFFAIKGENFDGHDYLGEAFSKGAACAVTSTDLKNRRSRSPAGKTVLKVADTVKALGLLAKYHRRQMPFKVIAVTGSTGKTTTKNMIHHVLRRHFNCHAAPKSFNNAIGVPLTLLNAEADKKIVITELGSNHPGEICYLSQITQPDIALITNIYPVHLEGFGSIEAVIKEKVSITVGLKKSSTLFVNGDFPNLLEFCRGQKLRFRTFGKNKHCDIHPCNIAINDSTSSFTIEEARVTVPLPGVANVENALAAWAVCRQFGLSSSQFARAIRTLPAIDMRLELLNIGPVIVLNDCYNANPVSMQNALDCLRRLGEKHRRRTVFVCGFMAELGKESEKFHAELGSKITKAGVNLLLIAGPFADTVAAPARKSTKRDLTAQVFENTAELCDNLQKFVESDDIILVKASRIAGFEQVMEKLKEIFQQSNS